MRLKVINCIFLAYAATALAEEPRPRRHLHQIKEMIVNKLFSSSEPNCTQSDEPPAPPPQLETKFFRIPGFNNVVIKAVPKGSNPEPTPVYEALPPNSHIGIVGSYLGTKTLNETYNALLGVKNLLTSGVLSAKRDALQEISQPPTIQIVRKPIQPCLAPDFIPLEPVPVLVNPPKVPVVPTQYMYKQVNQDGSVTTHTSSLELDNGVRVIEDGKTLPFIIDRVRKIPVRLPVPVLPEVSKIIVSKVSHPSSYMYQQVHQDGRLTSYMGLPSLMNRPGPVIVAETTKRIPPPPVFLMDRIEKVAAIASFPKAPVVDVVAKPMLVHAPATHVINAPVAPGPSGYSYSQMSTSGMTTHSASGVNAPVFVTENGLPNFAFSEVPSLPNKNPFTIPARSGYSYSQIHTGGKMTSFNGVGAQAGPVNVIEHKPLLPIPVSSAVPIPPDSFAYKQIGDGKLTTYTGQGIFEENFGPTVLVHGVNHPVPPPHITDRIEKVAAGAKFNRPPFSTPFAGPFAVPVPTNFVHVPAVHTSVPQRPVKIPSTSGTSPFLYRHIHNDGSVTTYGGDGSVAEEGKRLLPPPADMAMPFPQGNVRVFESPMYSGPFPMNPVNHNAIKPSTPVSGSFSYKMVNTNMRGSHPPVGPVDGPFVDTFSAPPPLLKMPAAIEGCIDPDIKNPIVRDIGPTMVGSSPVFVEKPIPLTYSYKQISHNNPNPFLVVNVEDPVRGVKNVNSNQNNQAYPLVPPPPLNPFPTVDVVGHNPASFIQPIPDKPAPIVNMPPPVPAEIPPTSSFSYRQVSSQAYPHMASPQPAVTVTEHKPTAFAQSTPFAPPHMTDMYLSPVPTELSPPSSFSYKQVTSQTLQPMPLPPPVDVVEHRPSVPANPPPMINMRVGQTENDKIPSSSFSYKQVTNQGLYEYSDQFPTGVKTNLHSSAPKPQEIPSGNVYVEPLPNHPVPASPIPIPAAPTPVPSTPQPTFNRQNSLVDNPIVVPEQSSFSFRSSNPDGSTITVKDDGHNSIAVQVQEATKTDDSSSMIPVSPAIEASKMGPVEEITASSVPEGTTGPVSGHAKPMRRRVLKRKRPVSHRGDIPDAEA